MLTDIVGVPPYERPVNMMFQSYALFPHLTVAGNVAFGLRQDGCGEERHRCLAWKEMLALVKLVDFATSQAASIVRRPA